PVYYSHYSSSSYRSNRSYSRFPFSSAAPSPSVCPGGGARHFDQMPATARRRELAESIARADADAVAAHNAKAAAPRRLRDDLGPFPYDGDLARAPLVLLVGSPSCDMSGTRKDAQLVRRGWPLSALHPDAPTALRSLWHARLSGLIEAFGAQHVANSVAAVPLTPWACDEFDDRLRLPSRHDMLALAAAAAARGGLLPATACEGRWTECAEIANLTLDQRFHPRSFRSTHVSVENLGAAAWPAACRRIEAHHWNRLAI